MFLHSWLLGLICVPEKDKRYNFLVCCFQLKETLANNLDETKTELMYIVAEQFLREEDNVRASFLFFFKFESKLLF